MEEENLKLYFIGPAGSGKSTMVAAMAGWMEKQDFKTTLINLDPGVRELPYSPNIDVREWVKLNELMDSEGLGPNGAQVAAADMVAFHSGEVKELMDRMKSHYVLVDTPGQSELFLFRNSSKVIVENLGRDDSAMIYLMDPFLSNLPSGFVSQVLLNAIVQFRSRLPVLNVISKADMVAPELLEKTLAWSNDFQTLYAAMLDEENSMTTQLSIDMLRVMEDIGAFRSAVPVSSPTGAGLEDLYAVVQSLFSGGEDIDRG